MVRAALVLLLLLIAVDVMGNMVIGGSWRNTLSRTAWKNRTHRYFGWCHRFIDGIPFFGPGHCERQFALEERFGNVWAAWRHTFNGG